MSAEDAQNKSDLEVQLEPECRAFVVLHKDPLRERIDVRVSRVLHLEEDVLFLAQTEPPVPRSLSGESFEVALLCPDGAGRKRPVGYVARLLDVREDYPLEDRVTLTLALAVTAPRPGDFFETSLRMHHRVPVDDEMNIVIRLEGHENVDLLDFSAGGARVRVHLPEVPPEVPQEPAPEPAKDAEPVVCLGTRLEPGPGGELDSEPPYGPETAPELAVELEAGPEIEPETGPETDPEPFALGRSIPFRLLFLGSGFAEGDGVVRSADFAEDGGSVTIGLFFTNMEIRDIRYLERMVARTETNCRLRERDTEYV